MVFGPGGYRFSDYLKIGVPMNIMMLIVASTLIPFIERNGTTNGTIGVGLFIPAIMVTIVALFVLIALDPHGQWVPSIKYDEIKIGSAGESAEKIENGCLKILKSHSIIVQDTSVSACSKMRERTLVLHTRSRGKKNKHEIMKQILSIPNVQNGDKWLLYRGFINGYRTKKIVA